LDLAIASAGFANDCGYSMNDNNVPSRFWQELREAGFGLLFATLLSVWDYFEHGEK